MLLDLNIILFIASLLPLILADNHRSNGQYPFRMDKRSGCLCREIPKSKTLCLGRDGCKSFPHDLDTNTTILEVRSTNIARVSTGDLDLYQHLEVLSIDNNDNLETIERGVFTHLSQLMNLSISFNPNWMRIQFNDTFEGLDNLRNLYLMKNGFERVIDATCALGRVYLPKLERLYLSENVFDQELTTGDFQPMVNSSMEELNLILCHISDIQPESFAILKNLKTLRLGDNSLNITTLTAALRHVDLKSLNLYSIGLNGRTPFDLLRVIGESNITNLNLARNRFEMLGANFFPAMPKLEVLDLREVLLVNISNDAFVRLKSLRYLYLGFNKFAAIPVGVLLEQLIYLDLQKSGSSAQLSLYGSQFANMRNLRHLDLSFNQIHALYNNSFTGLVNLQYLSLKHSNINYIANRTFEPLRSLVFLNLERNTLNFARQSGLNFTIFQGLANLRVLLLGRCDMQFLIIDQTSASALKSLKFLGLDKNKLTTPSIANVGLLGTLSGLNLTGNLIQQWDKDIINKNLTYLNLSNNKISHLTNAMIETFQNLSQLDLSNNIFTCDCINDNEYWRSLNSSNTMRLLSQNEVYCAFPDSANNVTLVEFLASGKKCNTGYRLLVLASFLVPTFMLLLAFAILGYLAYHYRWYFRYWIFLTRLYLTRKNKITKPKKNVQRANSIYTYDAFISYANQDANFVFRLVAMLEKFPPFVKLCVYERDFEVGTMISENVLQSVTKSRKTVLIISDSYAKSHWCRWESQIAEHHRIFECEQEENALVLIRLGPVNQANLTPTLKYLLKTRIYLQWDEEERKQKVFWEKLRGVLAPPSNPVSEDTHL